GSAIDSSVLSTISTKKARQSAASGIHAARSDVYVCDEERVVAVVVMGAASAPALTARSHPAPTALAAPPGEAGCKPVGMDIGKIGVWTSYRPFGAERAGEAAKLAESLGYGAWWVGGSPHVPDIRPILEATSTLVAATGILNVWKSDAAETADDD